MKDSIEYFQERVDKLNDLLENLKKTKEQDNLSKKKEFLITLNGHTDNVEGDGYFIHDNGMLQIFENVAEGITAALFKNWDCLMVTRWN